MKRIDFVVLTVLLILLVAAVGLIWIPTPVQPLDSSELFVGKPLAPQWLQVTYYLEVISGSIRLANSYGRAPLHKTTGWYTDYLMIPNWPLGRIEFESTAFFGIVDNVVARERVIPK